MNRIRKTLAAALMTGLLPASSWTSIAADVKVEDVANKMTGVVDDLGRKQTGEPVQADQKGIVSDLDALIAELEKEAQNAKGGIKKNKARKGMEDSTIMSGEGGVGDLVNPNDGGKDWTKLSDRERDRILQSMTEGFPPEYRTVLERYYRRLAEEKSAKASGGSAKAKDLGKPASTAKP